MAIGRGFETCKSIAPDHGHDYVCLLHQLFYICLMQLIFLVIYSFHFGKNISFGTIRALVHKFSRSLLLCFDVVYFLMVPCLPLAQISAIGFPWLNSLRSCDILSSSWMSVAWYNYHTLFLSL